MLSRILMMFFFLGVATTTEIAAASSWEETFLVIQSDSGALVPLTYASEQVDENQGLRVYKNSSTDNGTLPARCSYRDTDSPKRLVCTQLEGRSVRRVYESQQLSPKNASPARGLYKRFIGARLQSSVGSLQSEVYVCSSGCPPGVQPPIITITCAECGMDEWACNQRLESNPGTAKVNSELINLREDPDLTSRTITKLARNQLLSFLNAQPKCSEIQTSNCGLQIGRWIRVSVGKGPTEGWVFDAYVEYDFETRNAPPRQ
jgi:hypothetical protein